MASRRVPWNRVPSTVRIGDLVELRAHGAGDHASELRLAGPWFAVHEDIHPPGPSPKSPFHQAHERGRIHFDVGKVGEGQWCGRRLTQEVPH